MPFIYCIITNAYYGVVRTGEASVYEDHDEYLYYKLYCIMSDFWVQSVAQPGPEQPCYTKNTVNIYIRT